MLASILSLFSSLLGLDVIHFEMSLSGRGGADPSRKMQNMELLCGTAFVSLSDLELTIALWGLALDQHLTRLRVDNGSMGTHTGSTPY